MEKEIIKFNKKYNEKNIRTMQYRFPFGIYNCVICEKKVKVDDSFSNMGHKLICVNCATLLFPRETKDSSFVRIDFDKLSEWQEIER